MPRIKIDAVEWDDANERHATRHGVSVWEIEMVLAHATIAYRNRKHRTGDYFVRGTTTGGRAIKVVFAFNQDSHTARPIAAWEED